MTLFQRTCWRRRSPVSRDVSRDNRSNERPIRSPSSGNGMLGFRLNSCKAFFTRASIANTTAFLWNMAPATSEAMSGVASRSTTSSSLQASMIRLAAAPSIANGSVTARQGVPLVPGAKKKADDHPTAPVLCTTPGGTITTRAPSPARIEVLELSSQIGASMPTWTFQA